MFFGISLFSFYIAESTYRSGRGGFVIGTQALFVRKFFFSLGILFPSLLAGFRANDVGRDVNNIVVPIFEYAKQSSCFNELQAILDSHRYETDLTYNFLVYLTSKIVDDSWLILFLLQLLTILPLAIAAFKLKDKLSPTLAMMVYLLVFYNNSLNAMRQSITCGILVLIFSIIVEDNYHIGKKNVLKIAVLGTLAILMHGMTVIGILLIILLVLIGKMKISKTLFGFLSILILCAPLYLHGFVDILAHAELLPEKLLFYANVFLYQNIKQNWYVNPFSLYALLFITFAGMLVFVPLISDKWNRHKSENVVFTDLKRIVISGYLINAVILFSINTMYGNRISLFLDTFLILFIPYCCKKPNKSFKVTIIVALLLMYWLLWIIRMGWSGSSFYTFRF